MDKARAFFYVCAGLFLLALSYHLGARNATAQSGVLEGAAIDAGAGGPMISAVLSRTFLTFYGWGPPNSIPEPIPGTSPIVATSAANGTLVLLENGDIYGPGSGSWELRGNILSGPTPAQRESFGAMKTLYRGERGAAQPATKDR
jgi:hypothetical protein